MLLIIFLLNAMATAEVPPLAVAPDDARSKTKQWLNDRLWSHCYYESVYSRDDRRNIINDAWIKSGLHLFDIRERPLDVYLKTRLLYDRNRDFWNNRAEIGLGVQHQPLEDLGLVLYFEAINAIPTGREGADSNPDKDPFWDFRGGAYFWQWWGAYPWELEQTEWYIPFTGWREVYADAIYYYQDHNNFISTVDYKEGLALGRVGPVQFDAYITFEGGADINSDYWNNYAQIGPGFRITPFEELDLKIGFEYFEGFYFNGDRDGRSKSYSDFNVTLSFFYEF